MCCLWQLCGTDPCEHSNSRHELLATPEVDAVQLQANVLRRRGPFVLREQMNDLGALQHFLDEMWKIAFFRGRIGEHFYVVPLSPDRRELHIHWVFSC